MPSAQIPTWMTDKCIGARRIPDFASLMATHAHANSAFEAIDVESQGEVLKQIGLAFLPSLDSCRVPIDIMSFVEETQTRILCLESQGQSPRKRQRELFKWPKEGIFERVNINDVETKVVDFLANMKRSGGREFELVLVGFARSAESKVLFTQLPVAIPFISSWVDIQPIMHEVDRTPGEEEG